MWIATPTSSVRQAGDTDVLRTGPQGLVERGQQGPYLQDRAENGGVHPSDSFARQRFVFGQSTNPIQMRATGGSATLKAGIRSRWIIPPAAACRIRGDGAAQSFSRILAATNSALSAPLKKRTQALVYNN